MSWLDTALTAVLPTVVGGVLGGGTTYWQMHKSQSHQERIAKLQLEATQQLKRQELIYSAATELVRELKPIRRAVDCIWGTLVDQRLDAVQAIEQVSRHQSKLWTHSEREEWREKNMPQALIVDNDIAEWLESMDEGLIYLAKVDVHPDGLNEYPLGAVSLSRYYNEVTYWWGWFSVMDEALIAAAMGRPSPEWPTHE
ncbi:hypothetical protein ACQP2T_00380 [Nonomuraea sp. CA-143628]|uniref:hypothetical protein n=1 Tax=Nonomuraea sp. CA-143628 TaxID=3239997 RepID=UPI003D8F8381